MVAWAMGRRAATLQSQGAPLQAEEPGACVSWCWWLTWRGGSRWRREGGARWIGKECAWSQPHLGVPATDRFRCFRSAFPNLTRCAVRCCASLDDHVSEQHDRDLKQLVSALGGVVGMGARADGVGNATLTKVGNACRNSAS
eukprot:3774827-Rhodomonas_salina.1